jgi:very-short-patch-repair endonuclease
MKRKDVLNLLKEQKVIDKKRTVDSFDDIVFYYKENFLVVTLIDGEYHETYIFSDAKKVAELNSQAGGYKSIEGFKDLNDKE